MVEVSFQHWHYVFGEAELVRFGSPHFDSATAGRELSSLVSKGAVLASYHETHFDEAQIICANEAFPESAVSDPLADLEIWDEWRSGTRAFPYPGRYSRLGIRRQERKTQSTSSVGVLGEIFAGLYAQAGISPWVIVRVIRKWPDFIFYERSRDRYAFVEAKAFTDDLGGSDDLGGLIQAKLLGDCLVDAVQQLNADPFVTVWGAFTKIAQVTPLRLQVTFLELGVDEQRRLSATYRCLPEPIVSGLAERALSRGFFTLERDADASWELFAPEEQRIGRPEKRQLERRLIRAATNALEEVLLDAGPASAISASRGLLEKQIADLVRKVKIPEAREGRRYQAAAERASGGVLTSLRSVAGQSIFVGALTEGVQSKIADGWSSNWESAPDAWKEINGIKLWRCGGAIFGLGASSFEGTRIASDTTPL